MGGVLRVRFLDVGQGDAAVAILPGTQRALVIDVCFADRVLDLLSDEGIGEVVLFLSHSDLDHTRGAIDFLTGFRERGRVLAVVCSRDRISDSSPEAYKRLLVEVACFCRRVTREDHSFVSASVDSNLNHDARFSSFFPDDVEIRVVHPAHEDRLTLDSAQRNEAAGVVMIEHRLGNGLTRRLLLTADIGLTGMSLMLARQKSDALSADVLKLPHHGAWPNQWPGLASAPEIPRRTFADFLNAVSPRHIVVSVGFVNAFGHVRQPLFDLLRSYHENTCYFPAVDFGLVGVGPPSRGVVSRLAKSITAIYIYRLGGAMEDPGLEVSRKTVLVVLFVPSVERDGTTAIDQEYWVDAALETFGLLFGGATAFPQAKGVWRDDEMGGVLVHDQPVVIHCYTTPADIGDADRLSRLGGFCRRMGREARQGEVGLVIGDEYLAFRDFDQE